MGYYDLLQEENIIIQEKTLYYKRNCEGEEVVVRYEAGLTAQLVHLVEVAPVRIERIFRQWASVEDVSLTSWRLVSSFGGGSWHRANLVCQNPQ
jgi:hypothetical protein